jgi:hypothetical protein
MPNALNALRSEDTHVMFGTCFCRLGHGVTSNFRMHFSLTLLVLRLASALQVTDCFLSDLTVLMPLTASSLTLLSYCH